MTETQRNETGGEWEALCEQCGLCCFTKYEEEDGSVFHTAIPCRYLDVVSRRCKIYPRRFEICPECMQLTADLVRELNWLPEGCGYKKWLKAKSGKEVPSERHARGKRSRQLAKRTIRSGS